MILLRAENSNMKKSYIVITINIGRAYVKIQYTSQSDIIIKKNQFCRLSSAIYSLAALMYFKCSNSSAVIPNFKKKIPEFKFNILNHALLYV